MAKMYRYYQKTGGEEAWTPVQAHISLDEIRPTFVTILAVDTLLDDSTPRELRAKVKYQGPMYFDLDADDIQDSITGAQKLVKKLQSYELMAQDMQIYLSGKKGLHIIVPEVCFVEKSQPTLGLVSIYKEIAYKLAVDTLDFRVYTAKKGRQFRTCYNKRENGNYKVPITLAELDSLTPEFYAELCKAPRTVEGHNPQWRGKFALLYDSAAQKVGKVKPKVSKPVAPEVLKQQLPLFERVARGEQETEGGFNNIAMQLALYAREAKWDEKRFLEACSGVIANHVSDGSRYNTPARRERELVRMFWYLEENSSFEYAAGGLKACVKTTVQDLPETDDFGNFMPADDDEGSHETDFGGVYRGVTAYMASKGEDGDIPITNFVFNSVQILRSLEENTILQIKVTVRIRGKNIPATFSPSSFTGGTSLQNSVAAFGGSFSGTDIHARGVYQAMLREAQNDCFVLESEGVNLFKIGNPKKEYVVWADREGVKSATDMAEDGVRVTFQGFPDSRGLFQTDLIAAPTMDTLIADPEGRERALKCYKALVRSHTPEVMGKMLGWAVACFYAPLFHNIHRQFPLLHIYGPAGGGKTATTRGMLRHFYYRQDAAETTPISSLFALQQLMNGSASIPLLLDEYKPHTLTKEKLDQVRAILRDAYNAKIVQRGGGSKSVKDNFNALSTLKMQAPLVFVAEAPETETAIVERSVMVSFKRLAGREQSECFRNAMIWQRDTEPLASLGLEIANTVVSQNSASQSLQGFDKALTWAYDKFLPDPEDWEKVGRGEMTQEEMRVRALMRPRNVFNSTVAFFGLQVLKGILVGKFGDEAYAEHFEDVVKSMAKSCFTGMDTLAEATLPEYVKILSVFADMSKLPATDSYALAEGIDYNLSEYAEQPVLVLATSQCYRKYRAYMRHTSAQPLYPSEESFALAIREIPQFICMGIGTKRLQTTTAVLDLEGLYRAAVQKWNGRAVEISF